MGCTRGANLLSKLMCNCRYLHSKNKEALSGHPNPRNLSKLNDDLFEVQQIMTRNIQEVLGVGDRLDRMFLTSKCLDPLTFVDATLSILDQFACISCFTEELTSFFSWWISIKYSMSSALGSLSLLKSQTCWHLVIISGGSLIVKLKSS